jgi:predicted RNA binding protein YcfA (HicA-like mRNA interferase family)
MSRLPRVTGRQLILALQKIGFVVAMIRGSHHHLRHTDGRKTLSRRIVAKSSARDC